MKEELVRKGEIEYRPDIDGLRAIAVGFVLLFHAFASIARGGFVGVDIFFVISGFLITSIIHKQAVDGKFSFIAFYCKRTRRIFPALILVTAVTFAFGYYVLPPKAMTSLGLGLMGTAGFVQNFVLLSEAGYFDITSHSKPLLHIWSLGIEEQYYIFWPVILLAAVRFRLNLTALLLVLIVLSFLHGLETLERYPELGFYSPLARAWELLAGSLLAIWLRDGPGHAVYSWPARYLEPILQRIVWARGTAPRGHLVHDLASVIAIGLLLYALWGYDDHTPYPGVRALVPVVAAVLLILSRKSLFNRYVLSNRLMVGMGLISYPLYLWHFPLLAYAYVLMPDGVPWPIRLTLVIAAVVLAWLTYRFIERPVHKLPATPRAMAPFAAAMTVIAGLGAAAWFTGGMPFRLPAEVRAFYLTGEETSAYWRRGQCLLLPDQGSNALAADCAPSGQHPRIVLWGDSYAAAMAQGFVQLADEHKFSAGWLTASSCPPLIGYVHPDRQFCKEINDHIMARFEQNPPDIVILHGTWNVGAEDLEKGLSATVSRLRAAGVSKIVLLGPVISWKGEEGLAANFLDYYSLQLPHALMPKRTFFRANYDWSRGLDTFLSRQATALGIRFVSPLDVMCNSEGCLARVGDQDQHLSAYDSGHVTVPGATTVVRELLPQILEGW